MTKKTGQKSGKVPADAAKGVPPSGGEGDRAADRRYREKATRFERSGKVEDAADDAERALHDDERRELESAEKRGRAPARD
jgi:hypothetical protein